MNKAYTLTVGLLGEAGVTAVDAINPSDIATIGDLIIKLVIGVITIWGLLKKKKPSIRKV